MLTKINDDTIKITGKTDSNNAAEFEKALLKTVAASVETPIPDAEGPEYISNAGFRVFMKLRKQLGKPPMIKNVSSDVYEIFNVTGFTQLLDVRKKPREISIDGCEQIGEEKNYG